jgi:manganese transport protein
MEVGGFRRLEAAITGLVGVVVLAFCLEILMSRPSPSAVASGAFEPRLPGGAALLAVSIVGATVMPHVIYLHSALVRGRVDGATAPSRRRIFRFEIIDVLCAMGLAGLINLAMLATAAAVFFTRGDTTAGDDLGRVVSGLNGYVGAHAGTVFGVALLVSGVASSCVGTMAGQIVMEGFLRRRIPVFARRAVTMLPAIVVLALGFNPTRALVLSQVFLSFGIPFALIPLVAFTASRRVMGALTNSRVTTTAAIAVTAVIVALNVYLLATA